MSTPGAGGQAGAGGGAAVGAGVGAGVGAAVGTTVVHRRYVSAHDAHYAGALVDGAWGLGLFGDVATELCVVTDGDEGLFASYDDVQFRAPVRAGDVVEARATLVRAGRRSRRMSFELVVVARGAGEPARPSAATVLIEPVLATTAVGTVVVPEGVHHVDQTAAVAETQVTPAPTI